jgi:hypothetical protein
MTDGASGRGQFTLSWLLVPPSGWSHSDCGSLDVDQVAATLHNVATGETQTAMAPCASGALITDPLPLGEYEVDIGAFGLAGERADAETTSTHGFLLTDGQQAVLPAQPVSIAPPLSDAHVTWTLTKNGQPSSCAQLDGVTMVVWVVKPTNILVPSYVDCSATSVTMQNVGVGNGTVNAELRGPTTVIATATPVPLPAGRGVVDVELDLDAP